MGTHETKLEETPTAALLQELSADASLLVQRQIKLATLEAKVELRQGKSAARLFSVAGAAVYAGVIVLLVAAGAALGLLLGHAWLGMLIVAAALLIPGAISGLAGYRRARRLRPLERSRAELDREIAGLKRLGPAR